MAIVLLFLSSGITIALSIAVITVAASYVRCAASTSDWEGVDCEEEVDDTVDGDVFWQQTQDHLPFSEEGAVDVCIT